MMQLIDRYMLTRVGLPLFGATSIALAALLMERLIRLLDLFANKGGPIVLILQMLVNLTPHYLAIALPVALFVGTLYAAMRLSGDSELDALRGSGMSLLRIATPVLILAFFMSLLCLYILGYLQPYTRYTYRALVYLVTETAWDSALERGAFFSGFDGKTILIGDIYDQGRALSKVYIYEKEGTKQISTTAETGRLVRDPQQLSLRLHLIDGVRVEADAPGNAQAVRFNEIEIPLNNKSPDPFRERGDKESELNLSELLKSYFTGVPETDPNDTKAEIHRRLVQSISVLFLPLLAFPIGVSSRRTAKTTRVLFGSLLMIFYYQIIQFGQSLVENGKLAPSLALWVPFVIFSISSLWLFYQANTKPGQDSFAVIFESLEQYWQFILSPFSKEKRQD